MRIDELRDVLHEHAADPVDIGGSARSRAVHERVRVRRRRRAAGVAGGTLATVALVAALVVPSLGSPGRAPEVVPAAPGPSAEGPGMVTRNGLTFMEEMGGARQIGAAIGDPGTTEVTMWVTLPQARVWFTGWCYGPAARDHELRVYVDGHAAGGTVCEPDPPPGPVAGSMVVVDGPAELRRWGLLPGDEVEVRARLVPRGQDVAAAVSGHDMVIGAALYAEEARKAGLPERVNEAGRTWRLVSSVESTPGEEYLDLRTERRDEPTLVVLSTAGLEDPGQGTVLLDGQPIEGLRDLPGAAGRRWQTVWGVEAGRRREVLVQVDEGLTAQTRISLGEYVPAE